MLDDLRNLKNLQNLKDKVEDLAESHGEKITEGLEKAGDFIDDKTSGKYSKQIDSGVDKAQEFVERLGERKSGD
ncbi:antitoxin [Streptomyces alkaliterrae]|uniref:Antitoxin n=1 Tax=Streptomyces alkaliterrae TaxID=2213162 RepID=A0A5P0YNA1_9ACTN|nr:antitoxin [Streptomyces alkaliterrae]MBB1252616.1 antitoxin [Streptomyces alkaliterrae]MBB1259374.1 antitoxin [Streptomyces alkaliterrae]MQS01776.1 antitoxin [Streptomyces alkaliterrae]